ncbi:hypothetical protein C8F04DRAFT_1168287 [Mycena alexandri]|uniref:G domain-containing protein n=1 Tax=Mycena alexandri TaxID=1745969 RepID=A0AAD6RWU2_9AGAR|nr:hypothetical protein C8F04DRAFT_1168462 [Mycena alexandri]KAJ7015956.1 hypothetical protein C8F04DRAFT_1168287 [Mycena alexandri]
MDENNAINLREKCGHFRILVIGRANAGKTTILKKVCNSAKDPKIFSPSGKKLRLATVKGSAERGEHNIDNELIFKSNPKFIFHDSRGFESGSVNETETVKAFIERRAASETLSEQIHVIWYCLPTDTPRPLLEADEQFFNYSGSGKVPVIAIFTKFDGLVTTALQKLRNEGKTRREAMADATEVAQGMLTADFVDQLNKMSFPPSDYVQVDDLRNEASTCIELINKTANSLNDDTLRLLFVSVQQNNIDLCILYAMKQMLESNSSSVRASLNYTLMYFPHVWSVSLVTQISFVPL